ncbi:hypothetical protein LX36DRAFT_653000 [Colletotrichum falcatum]|nr:hypothetical protein LX36DRAFT_653000 [Colletotrichum falcatum]
MEWAGPPEGAQLLLNAILLVWTCARFWRFVVSSRLMHTPGLVWSVLVWTCPRLVIAQLFLVSRSRMFQHAPSFLRVPVGGEGTIKATTAYMDIHAQV